MFLSVLLLYGLVSVAVLCAFAYVEGDGFDLENSVLPALFWPVFLPLLAVCSATEWFKRLGARWVKK